MIVPAPEVLASLAGGRFRDAVRSWNCHRSAAGACGEECPYATTFADAKCPTVRCAWCLEGRLMALSLRHPKALSDRPTYHDLARRLREWRDTTVVADCV